MGLKLSLVVKGPWEYGNGMVLMYLTPTPPPRQIGVKITDDNDG